MTYNTLNGKLKEYEIRIDGHINTVIVDGILYIFTTSDKEEMSVYRLEATVEELDQ